MSLVLKTRQWLRPGASCRAGATLAAASATMLLLAACQAGDRTLADVSNDVAGLEVRRIGDYDSGDLAAQDRAIVRSLARMAKAGVDAGAIAGVTVSAQPEEENVGNSRSRATFFLWFAVKGCDGNVLFIAGPSGNLVASDDKGGCLTDSG